MENLSEQEIIRREKAKKLETLGVDPFGAKFERTHSALQIKDKAKDKSHEQLEEEKIIVKSAGRIIAIRDMGKAAFFTIQDRDSAIQAYIRKDVVGEEAYQIFGLTDIGDFVGVEGRLMLTKTGEVTIRAEKYFYLTKALRPLPEKFHGLSDIEERYRRRYLDLIANKEARDIAYIRPKIIRATQNYFDSNGFIEVETPILQPILGGANAKPFSTHHNALDMDFYLRIATELPLKRLIVGGMEKVYEIGRLFRNEGMSNRHNPEFTTIEVYQAYSDMRGMMEVTEGVIRYIATTVFQKTVFEYNGKEIDLGKPFEKRTMVDLVKEYSGVDFSNNYTVDQAKQLAKEHNVKIEKHYSVGHIINAFFETFAEDKLVQPIFVCEHPIEVSPLAKKARDPRFADRFELFIDGREYANAYSELNDPIDQRQRFESQVKEKSLGNDEACEMDVDFVEALEYGMPPTGGLGIGLDRLIMLLTGAATIREILLFPHMKIRN